MLRSPHRGQRRDRARQHARWSGVSHVVTGAGDTAPAPVVARRVDPRRALQLALAATWLLDGILQLQPSMFARGRGGFSSMLASTALGNPGFVAHSITWNASLVARHPGLLDGVFAAIQVVIGLGIAWRPSVRVALAASVAWALVVWWFGEGLGGILHGAGTPLGGGPGAVLFYGLLAVLVWPQRDPQTRSSFVAMGLVGAPVARALWSIVWGGLAVLSLLGPARSPGGTSSLIASVVPGEPGWLAGIDRHVESAVFSHGLAVAISSAFVFTVLAFGVHSARLAKPAVVLAALVAIVMWVLTENFGTILAGGATDPNSGPLLVLLALAYWPLREPTASGAEPVRAAMAAVS